MMIDCLCIYVFVQLSALTYSCPTLFSSFREAKNIRTNEVAMRRDWARFIEV